MPLSSTRPNAWPGGLRRDDRAVAGEYAVSPEGSTATPGPMVPLPEHRIGDVGERHQRAGQRRGRAR